ncbi:MAG: AI-2E family transporter [Spartobacteria bacterium]
MLRPIYEAAFWAGLTAMTLVGILTWTGLMLLGVPLALPLSPLVMILGFIPNLGPILAALPAFLIAMSHRTVLGLYVALLYTVVQMLEGYVITPLIQQRAIRMPPALLIAAIVAAGLLFGFLGMLLAAPMSAVLLVFVQRFYLEDVLGDPAVRRESRKE